MNLTDIEKKILVLAMDRSANTGEVATAALKLIELLRRRYPSGHDLIKDLEQIKIREEVRFVNVDHDPYGNFVMPFGKHRGQKLKDIPIDYLIWLLDNYDGLRETTRKVIENFVA
jgi:hypothetical protein